MTPPYDTVVIGAGISGLAVACLLAEEGRRVVVLEHHRVAGGLLQRFRRRGVPFDTGFHYVGGAGPGGPLRRYLGRLGVLDRIVLEPFDADGFDEVVLPGRRVTLAYGNGRAAAHLTAQFPAEAAGIRAFFDTVAAIAADHPMFSFASEEFRARSPLHADRRSLVGFLDEIIGDPDLKAALCSHAVLYGVPGGRAPLEAHALVCSSYFHSAHGVAGGGEAVADALVARLTSLGGEVRLRTPVAGIVVEGGAVAGVVTEAGETIAAASVVSTAHPAATLGLLPPGTAPPRSVRRVQALHDTAGALLVHAIVRDVPPEPLRRNRIWFARTEDAWLDGRPWFRAGGTPPRFALLPGPAAPETAGSTVFQVLCPMDGEHPHGENPPDDEPAAAHQARKVAAAQRIVPLAEACVPAWTGRIEVVDVSTPRAVRRFVRSPTGSCFGVANDVDQWRSRKFPQDLGVPGLLLAGQSVGLPGVLGSLVTAFVTAGNLVGGADRLYDRLRRDVGA